jgi:hypothetical protein
VLKAKKQNAGFIAEPLRSVEPSSKPGKKQNQILSDYFVDSDVEPRFREAYPSAYHPPPLSSKEHAEMIFLAFLPHLGQVIERVSIFVSSSVTSPHLHSNSYTGMFATSSYTFAFNVPLV